MFADSRSVADWLRPGAAPFSPYSGPQYMSAGADSRVLQAAAARRSTSPADRAAAVRSSSPPTSRRTGTAWSSRRGRHDGPEQRRLDDAAGGRHRRRRPPTSSLDDGRAPATAARRGWRPAPTRRTRSCCTTGRATCEPTGTTGDVERVHRLHRRLGGLDRRPVRVRGQEGRLRISRDHRLGHAGPRRLGRRRRGSPTARRRIEFNDFEADDGGWADGPPPEGTDTRSTAGRGAAEEFEEGGVVATDDTVYTGFGFEGINESRAQRVHEAHADPPRRPDAPAAGRRLEHRHGRRSAGRSRPRAARRGRDDAGGHAQGDRPRPSARARRSSPAAS